MEFWTPFMMPLSDSMTFSWSNCVTVKSKDQRPMEKKKKPVIHTARLPIANSSLAQFNSSLLPKMQRIRYTLVD